MTVDQPEFGRWIPGMEGKWAATEDGLIWSKPRRRTKGGFMALTPTGRTGHLVVRLARKTYYVHVLIAATHLGPRPEGQQVRHLDGNPPNNHVTNLAYGTAREQRLDDVRNGVHNHSKKTHCIRGHEFTPENTRVYRGRRSCRACHRQHDQAYRDRKEAA